MKVQILEKDKKEIKIGDLVKHLDERIGITTCVGESEIFVLQVSPTFHYYWLWAKESVTLYNGKIIIENDK